VIAREFIFGFNQTGLVTNISTTAVGGESVNYTVSSHDVIAAAPDIFVGSGSTTSTVIAPSATIAAWDSFLATRVPSGSVNGSGGTMATESKNGGTQTKLPLVCFAIGQVVWFVLL
jgi:carboxypeptidase D